MTTAHSAEPPELAALAGPGGLGSRATLVQLSSAFCAPCRAARSVLERVVETTDGVRHIELDVNEHLALGERLRVIRTPTILVLGPDGRLVGRREGVPRLADVRELVDGAAG